MRNCIYSDVSGHYRLMKIFGQSENWEINADFDAFNSDVSWFIKPNSKIEFLRLNNIQLSEEFRNTFLELSKLIDNSRQTHLTIDSEKYILFAWDTKEGEICGWLNKQQHSDEFKCELIAEHALLLRNIGGIQESFNQPEGAFSNNQNFMFIGSDCSRGIGDWDDYYAMKCEDEQKEEIDYSNLLAFAYEANAALTLYEPDTRKVLLFSHDHSFDNVAFMENQPKYTFHTFKNVDNFTDYVEELAKQWKEIIK
jgi:hypothetical protein